MFKVLANGEGRPRRKTRTPNFNLAGNAAPYGLQPLFVHPVLPGETHNQTKVKLRLASEPVKNPFAGAWLELWTVYVKLTDIDPTLSEMFISENMDSSAFEASEDQPQYFTKTGQIEWVKLCTEAFHDHYFVNEGEAPREIDNLRQTTTGMRTWSENLRFAFAVGTNPDSMPAGVNRDQTPYEMMRQMQMSEMTYEQYLKEYGVRSVAEIDRRPEILSYARQFTQPVNTIDPQTGAPTSAFVLNVDTTSDKKAVFKEPGFLCVFATFKPKVYSPQAVSLIGSLWGFNDWYPIYNVDDPSAAIKEIDPNDPVFQSAAPSAGTLWFDRGDLLFHGEQFVRERASAFAPSVPLGGGFDVSASGLSPEVVRGDYVTQAQLNALTVSGSAFDFYYEGIAQCSVKGHVKDLV